jgi:hypothetical protein
VVPHHMLHCAAIPFTETFAKFPACVSFDGRMFVHAVVIGVGMTVPAHIVPRSFDALVKSTALGIAVFRWGLSPAVLIVVLHERRMGGRLGFESARVKRACRYHADSKQAWSNPLYLFHK